MSMKLDDIPEVKSCRYPKPITVKVSSECDALLERLDGLKKDRSEFLRMAIERALEGVFPGELKKRERLTAKA